MKTTIISLNSQESLILQVDAAGVGKIESTIQHGRKGSKYDTACHVLESFALAAFIEGVPIRTLRATLTTVMDAIANEYGD